MSNIDVQLIDGPVRIAAEEPFPPEGGAECIFLGRTRQESHPQHGALRRLKYEAYQPMAEDVLHRLAREAIARFGCISVQIHHSIGEVPRGEASVFIRVVSGHRAEAFEACRFLIDDLKSNAPIWKREEWERGATWSEGFPVDAARSERP